MIKLLSPRGLAALRYLGWSAPFYKWRVSRARCPSCHGKYFLSLGKTAFMTRCLSCGANVTNLSLIPVIQQHQAKLATICAWEMSTFGGTLNFLKANFKTVIESEYFSGVRSGDLVNDILNQDVQQLSFQDESLDLITSSQVFEHVADDLKGYKECYRVLRKNGALIFSIPLHEIPKTKKIAELIDNEIIFHGEPEYHDSRSTGPKTVLTFWHHSVHDICERVAKAGFEVQLVEITIPPSQKIPTKVIYAVKN